MIKTPRCVSCPVCFGAGQITGPKTMWARIPRIDPWYLEPRDCDECEGTGVVTGLTAAAIEAESMQRVMPIVDKVMAEWRDERVALARWESEGGAS